MLSDETVYEIEDYVDAFEEIKNRIDSDEVATVILQELSKDSRLAQIQAERLQNREGQRQLNGEQPASSKQVNYLEFLGVKVPKNLTKKRASELIDQAISNSEPAVE